MDNETIQEINFNSRRTIPVNREILSYMQEIFKIKKNLEKLGVKNDEQWELIKGEFMSQIAKKEDNLEE